MTETAHEHRLRDRVRTELGGWCIKLLPWVDTGLTDRLVLLPGARVRFVETKFRTKKLRPTQRRVRRKLSRLGFEVYVLHTREAVDNFIEQHRGD